MTTGPEGIEQQSRLSDGELAARIADLSLRAVAQTGNDRIMMHNGAVAALQFLLDPESGQHASPANATEAAELLPLFADRIADVNQERSVR